MITPPVTCAQCVSVALDLAQALMGARGDVGVIMMELAWRRWEGCSVMFGPAFAAEDRTVVLGAAHGDPLRGRTAQLRG